MNKGKARGSVRDTGGPRRTKWPASQSVARALLRRQALGRRGRLPSSHGLPKAPARLVYSMSNVIPVGQRHDRVILGFTADGEQLVCCCGPVSNPWRLELRRVRLQCPGLSRPGEALWSLPLKLRGRGVGGPFDRGQASESFAADGGNVQEEEEEEEDDEHGLGMGGMGGQEPASVAVTESADGFLVVAVVSPRFPSSELREEEEDRVYRVFVAPGPSYVTAVRDACVEHPFSGVAFSYIVPAGGGQGGGGGAPVPSIVAHDVGAVGVAGGAGGRAGEELVYVIVVNAVDAIRAVEVRLRTDDARAPPPSRVHVSTTGERSPLPPPPRTKFTLRPPTPPVQPAKKSTGGGGGGGGGGGLGGGGGEGSSSSDESGSGGAEDDPGGRRGGDALGDGGAGVGDGPGGGGGGSGNFDPSSVWWARGRDLPSSPLVGTRSLPCPRRPVAGGGVAATARGAAAVSAAEGAEPGRTTRRGEGAVIAESALPSSSSAATSVDGEGVAEGDGASSGSSEAAAGDTGAGAGRGAGVGGEGLVTGGVGERLQAAPAAPARRRRRGRRKSYATADRSRQCVLDLEVFISQLLLRREAFPDLSGVRQPQPPPPTPIPIPAPPRKRKSSGSCGGSGGGEPSGGAPAVLATDYHCVTVGLMDGGRRVLLCLVVEVVYTGERSDNGGRGGGGGNLGGGAPRAKDGGAGAGAGSGMLGFVLALDLECGEVAVLETRSGPGRGKRCALLCETLARSFRRGGGASVVDRPGRRLSNANVLQGRSLGAIVNPVYPVAIVMGASDR